MAKKRSIIRINLILSLGFGMVMGMVFPVYAGFFVQFNSSTAKIVFSLGCLAAGIMVGFGAFFITKMTLLRVVNEVSREMSSLSGKGADLTRKLPVVSNDAIGRLPSQFNRFLGSVKDIFNLTLDTMSRTREMSEKLISNMNQTHQTVEDIAKTIDDLNLLVNHQAEQVLLNHKIGDDLNKTIDQSAALVLDLLEQMRDLTGKMTDQAGSIDTILDHTDRTSALIGSEGSTGGLTTLSRNFMRLTEKALEQDSQAFNEMSDFISKIEDIFSRTGTLSINASIEAARSGKSGEGFSVIAQEIRSLSTEAESLSSQIRNNLDLNTRQILSSRKEIASSRQEVDSQLQEAMDSLQTLQEEALFIGRNTRSASGSYGRISELLEDIQSRLAGLQDSSGKSRDILIALESTSSDIKDGMAVIVGMSERINSAATLTGEQVKDLVVSINEVTDQFMSYKTKRQLK